MSDLKELLERGLERFDPSAERAFDKTLGRVRRRQRNRRITAAVVAFALFAGALTGIWAAFRGSHRAVPTGQPKITATVAIPGGTTDVAVGPEGVWVATKDGAAEIDPATAAVIATVGLGVEREHRIGVGYGFVWLANLGGGLPTGLDNTITVIDPREAHVVASIHVPGWLRDFTLGGGSLWALAISQNGGYRIWNIDPSSFNVGHPIAIPQQELAPQIVQIAYGAGALWITTGGRGMHVVAKGEPPAQVAIDRVDPATGDLEKLIETVGTARYLAVAGGSVWLATETGRNRSTVIGTDVRSKEGIGTPVSLPALFTDISAAQSGVWLTDSIGRVWRVDPRTGKLGGLPVKVGGTAQAIAADDSGAWVVGGARAYRFELCQGSRCGVPKPSPSIPPPLVAQDLTIRDTSRSDPACPPIGMVAGNELLTAAPGRCVLRLSQEGSGTLYGWISPVAVDSVGSDMVAYNTAIAAHGPLGSLFEIRVRSLSGEDDFQFVQLASSLAWGADGHFAYFKLTPQGGSHQLVGEILVGRSPSEGRSPQPAVPWIVSPHPWIVAAWAQNRLLVYKGVEGEGLRLFVLDGPGRMRPFGPPETNERLVAISPDGSQAFVALGDGGDIAAVFDLTTGQELSRVDMTGLMDPDTDSTFGLAYAGSWTDSVVAASGGPGLMLFRVTDGHIELTGVLRIPDGINEPQLIGGVNRVVGWQHLVVGGKDRYRWIDCDLEQTVCEVGPSGPEQLNVVYNPSRPEG